MPAKTKEKGGELMAMVLEFLVSSGLSKTAKKLKSEVDQEVRTFIFFHRMIHARESFRTSDLCRSCPA